QDPDRLSFEQFRVVFKGDHKDHTISYDSGVWTCDCEFYASRGVCSHIMTVERVLAGMVEHAQALPTPA
ncbi:MAG: SWIM zinc finger family protein, partial [Chloroflexota bacterium]